MVADLNQKTIYQKCLDPECREVNYRSPGISFERGGNSTDSFFFSSITDDDELLVAILDSAHT
ncbi:unnamed protein product [Protopolystoma xenopodis]|uniref:Uncharacterized protein n=1 Tax=Protopolystoma xenopodis TaxID=117903 RepID=A0A448X2Q7_9PLAT|nr:unnamed protein product [Protopolystoma xenopodis]